MKKDELTAMGLTEDQAAKVFELHGKEITKLQNTVTTLTADRDGMKTQLDTANKKLAGYDPEWKTKAEAAQAEADKKVSALKFDYALSDALKSAKARDVLAVKAHLDMNGLKQNGDEIVGLKEQLDKIKSENSFLFEDEKPGPSISLGGHTPGATNTAGEATANEKMNSAIREAFGHAE